MVPPTIRIDDEVWEYLKKRARPLIDTPNSVLRRALGIDQPIFGETKASSISTKHGGDSVTDSIFIVVNAAGKVPDDRNARDGHRLANSRVSNGADILARNRFADAKRKLTPGTRIVMHQGGALTFRRKYGSGQLVAAGTVKEPPRELSENDKRDFSELYRLTLECYPGKPLVGIVFYSFPKGLAPLPLPKEQVPYRPNQGDNFIEIKPEEEDRRYSVLNKWWEANS